MLNVFLPCTLQIGDRDFYTMKESDGILQREEWKQLERRTLGVDQTAKTSASNPTPPSKGTSQKKKTAEASSKKKSKTKDEEESENSSDYEDLSSSDEEEGAARASSRTRKGHKGAKRRPRRGQRHSGGQGPRLGSVQLQQRAMLSKTIEVGPGKKLVVETLSTRSEAEVVWQVGYNYINSIVLLV